MQHTAIIVDDELNNRENLKSMLEKHCPSINIVGEAGGVAEATSLLETIIPDVVFLDIEMPGGNGFQLLNQGAVPFKVIFVTAYDGYALKAIQFSALDYILKPIDREQLVRAVDRISKSTVDLQHGQLLNLDQYINQQNKKLALHLSEEVRLVPIADIIRIESDSNYSNFVLKSGESILTSKNLGYFYKLLQSEGFARVHQSHVVNRNQLERYIKREGGYLLMSNGDQIPVSRSNRRIIPELFSN